MMSTTWVLALMLAYCAAAVIASDDISAQLSSRKLMQVQRRRFSAVQPRLDVAEIGELPETDPYRVMMLLAWQQLTTSTNRASPLSYWQVSGVHGKNWVYNGVPAPEAGYCKHSVPEFAPWHRAYMRQFEVALIQGAREAAAKFQNATLRAEYQQVAEVIRLPYWDWTSSSIPSILTTPTVTVLDFKAGNAISIRNPFGAYQYTAAAGDGKSAGASIVRSSTWTQAASRGARRFGNEMALFLRSNTWRCSYVSTATCVGNLESTHNEIHNVVGGTAGELTTFTYAGFDPLFWLLHSMVDKVLWLFQYNGGQWMAPRSYSPFNLEGDASEVTSMGYTFSTGRAIRCDDGCSEVIQRNRNGNNNRNENNRNTDSGNDSSSTRRHKDGGHGTNRNHDNHFDRSSGSNRDRSSDENSGSNSHHHHRGRGHGWAETEVAALDGRAAVLAAIEQWTGNYTGFSWSVRFTELDQHQLNQPVHLLVFLKSTGPSVAAAIPAKVEDLNELRLRPNYCGSIAGFNEHAHTHLPAVAAEQTVSRTIDLTQCLEDNEINPDVPAINPQDVSRGPAQVPVRRSNLQIVALTASGEDVTDKFNVGKTVISWSVPVTRTVAELRAAAAADPIEAQAVAANPLAFGADQQVQSVAMGDVVL